MVQLPSPGAEEPPVTRLAGGSFASEDELDEWWDQLTIWDVLNDVWDGPDVEPREWSA